jgi:hypothetical protein
MQAIIPTKAFSPKRIFLAFHSNFCPKMNQSSHFYVIYYPLALVPSKMALISPEQMHLLLRSVPDGLTQRNSLSIRIWGKTKWLKLLALIWVQQIAA